MTIDFFGDSITWQNGYIEAIDKAVKAKLSNQGKHITLVNRGINGGGVLQIRDGAKEGGFPGSSSQGPFAKVIAADKADVAMVFIGINDVWWRGPRRMSSRRRCATWSPRPRRTGPGWCLQR